MNNFLKGELEGRELLDSFLKLIKVDDVEFTTDKYNPVDVYFNYKGKKVVGEIKVRDIRYLNYDTHIMEVSKYNNMILAKKNKGCDCGYYINFFGNNVMYLYSLSNIAKNSIRTYLHCNRTTAINTGKTDKEILEINVDCALKFIKSNGVWKKLQKN